MTGDFQNPDLSLLTVAASNLPEPVKIGFIKAFGELLGGVTAIPTVWLRSKAQAIEDLTNSRTIVNAALTNAVAERTVNDPLAVQVAQEIYMPTNMRKAINRVRVAHEALKYATEESLDGKDRGEIDQDWINHFSRYAEDASSERLQNLFGRILAGEVCRPGMFSLATLRAVSELDQQIANDFSMLWARSVDGSVDYNTDLGRGEWFVRWKRLAEAGLMGGNAVAQFLPDFNPVIEGNAAWSPLNAEGSSLMLLFSQSCSVQWNHIEFTRIGREIGSLIAKPDYIGNMRQIGLRLIQPGIHHVEIQTHGKPPEVLYSSRQG